MIVASKFEYGSKRIDFDESHLFLDYVFNVHDLTEWEERLEQQGETYAVYSVTDEVGQKRTTEYKWALLSEADISFNQTKDLGRKEVCNESR